MAFTESEIRSLANLAHVSLSDDEVRESAAHLERLLGYIARLQAIDVSSALESVASLGLDDAEPSVALRSDVARPGFPREVMIAAAPAAPLGLFEVPRVVVRSGATPLARAVDASIDDESAP